MLLLPCSLPCALVLLDCLFYTSPLATIPPPLPPPPPPHLGYALCPLPGCWLVNWLIGWVVGWLVGGLLCCSLIRCSVVRCGVMHSGLVSCGAFGCLVGWFVGWLLVGSLTVYFVVGQLKVWYVGAWLVFLGWLLTSCRGVCVDDVCAAIPSPQTWGGMLYLLVSGFVGLLVG